MPWELDYALYSFTQLKKSKYYLPSDIKITIETVLNLSNYKINWKESKLPKELFIHKYNNLSLLLTDYNHIKRFYEGDKEYGHLDFQKEIISEDVDYYLVMCPDIIFDEHLLAYYCEAIKQIKNEYFLITPQIPKMWDSSWDILVNPLYKDTPYELWQEKDCFDIIHNQDNSQQEIKLTPLPTSKFAGWFDIMNKNFYEKLVPIWEEWIGYGGWDYYSMIVSDTYKRIGGDFQQYLLEGQTITEWSNGIIKNKFNEITKDFLVLNKTPNRGEIFKHNVMSYAQKRIQELQKDLAIKK